MRIAAGYYTEIECNDHVTLQKMYTVAQLQ